jgi:hypothetical protein
MSYEYAADEDGNYSYVWQDDVYTDPDSGDITTTDAYGDTTTATSNGDPATRFGPDYTYDEATGYYTNVADPSFVMDRDANIIDTSVKSSGKEPEAQATGPTSTAGGGGTTAGAGAAGGVKPAVAAPAAKGTGAQVTELQKSLPAQAWNAIKGAFTKTDGTVDWKALAAAGGGVAGLATSLKNQSNPTPLTGYQGKIPQLTAVQQQVAGTNDPTRRPGSSGQRYFSDLLYAPASSVPSAQTATQAQAQTFAAQNAANPAVQPAVPLASGGITALAKGRYLAGSTDGMADKLPANIDGNQEARLSHGEFVIPADVVSHLGNGNSESGANRLYSMMDKIRKARTGTTKQGKRINPDKFLPGGAVGYAEGGIATFAVGGVTGTGTGTTTANPAIIGQESNLSNWAGDYVTNMLGKGKALSDTPYQSYSGPLTAGATAGQTAAFDASAGLKAPTSQMGAFTPQTFTSDQAQKYMNPFVSSALNPQMEEMRRQSQLNLQPNMAKLTQAGGYGGSRQALMSSEANRNLLQEQNKTIGQGYQTAFDKAMAQFNTEQGRGLEAQSANNAYGLQALSKQAELGGMQRGITQEGITADKAQFEEEKQDPYKKVGFQQSLLSGLPVAAQSNTYQQPSLLNSIAGGATTIAQLYDTLFPAKKN